MVVVLVLTIVLLLQLLRDSGKKNEKLITALEKIDDLHGYLHCSDSVTAEIKEVAQEALK